MGDELYLSLLRQPETGSPTILALAANGILAASEEGVSVLGAPLSEAERDILRQAELVFEKDVTTFPARWQARCHGQALACAVNDARLKRGESSPVVPGDRIEIGLLRFKVVVSDGTASLSPRRGDETSGSAEASAESFELDTLAETLAWDAAGKESNPFDIVGIHDPEFDDARRDSTKVVPEASPAPEKDVLVRLADEYAQVILDPDHLYQQPWEETTPEPGNLAVLPPDASPHGQEWETGQSLEDFVSGKLTIQDILDRLGIDDFQPLKVAEPADEVLALFAQGLGRKRTERLPLRTRRDHHRISLDSHYQPPEEGGGSLTDAQKPDADS